VHGSLRPRQQHLRLQPAARGLGAHAGRGCARAPGLGDVDRHRHGKAGRVPDGDAVPYR
jgi:hypothetical protein